MEEIPITNKDVIKADITFKLPNGELGHKSFVPENLVDSIDFHFMVEVETEDSLSEKSVNEPEDRPLRERLKCTVGDCKKSYWKLHTLNEHIKGIHEGGYHCVLCKRDYSDRGALRRHEQAQHGVPVVYRCFSKCNMEFGTEKERNDHHSAEHGGKRKYEETV